MTDIKTIMSWLEGLAEPDWRLFHSDSEVQTIAKETLVLLQELGKPDCEHAEHDGIGCLGYSGWLDDEPIEACKNCSAYTGNRYEEMNKDA